MVFPDQQASAHTLDIQYISSSKTKVVYIETHKSVHRRDAVHINRMESATCGRDYMTTLSVAQAIQ
jgi:hypothetical protein